MAELIERLLAALIVIMLLGIVLYLVTRGTVITTSEITTPAPPVAGEVQYAKKTDRLPEARPADYKRDWSRSPTLVVPRDRAPVRVVHEEPYRPKYKKPDYRPERDYSRSEYRRSYDRYEQRYYERAPVEYSDSAVYSTYNYDDCSGADCACACGRPPYWSNSGWACPD